MTNSLRAALAAAIVIPTTVDLCLGVDFAPGRIYSSYDGGFIEWNQSLQVQRTVSVPGLSGGSGIVFNSAGNLVMIGSVGSQGRLLEINPNGQIVRSRVLDNGGGLLRGSYVDFDPASNRYIIAESTRIRLLDSNFNAVATSAATFQRASGVAFGADGRIYATDQFSGILSTYSSTLQPLSSPNIGGSVRTGMERANNGDLLLTAFGSGTIQRRTQGGVLTTLVSGLGFGNVSDVDQLPDGRIVSISASNTLTLYSETGQVLATGSFGQFGDGVAYFVPGPAASIAFAFAALIAGRRRR